MTAQRPVVVGIDGSASALHAARWAAEEATRRGAPLRLVHFCYLMPVRHPQEIALPPQYYEALLGQGRNWLDAATEAAREAAPGIVVETDLRDGVAADLLVRESRSAELIVLGSRGLGGFRGLLIGSVAVAVSAHGHCPVVVMHSSTVDAPPPRTGPVVVGVDGSALSDAAVEFAFEAAAARGVRLIAVHTWLDVDMAGAWTALPWTIDWRSVQVDEERLLNEHIAGWSEKFPGVDVLRVVDRDRPVRALLERATGAQLIVVGSRGRGAVRGMGLGSVSQSLLHHAECPVAVVRIQGNGLSSVVSEAPR